MLALEKKGSSLHIKHYLPNYICAFVPGGTFFFTVNLLERRRLLTDYIDDWRVVFTDARRRRPFTIDAIVVLHDHLYSVWTLPVGDGDFPPVGVTSRHGSRHGFRNTRGFQGVACGRGNGGFGNGVSGSTGFAMKAICSGLSIMSITIRSNTAMCRA